MSLLECLPCFVVENYTRMINEDLLSGREKALFTDVRLTDFWLKAKSWFDLQDEENKVDASEYFLGVFLSLLMLYGKAGDAQNPSPKKKIIECQHEADKLIDKASKLADKLASVLIELDKTSPYLQYEAQLLPIVRQLIPPLRDVEISSYYDGVSTHQAITILKESLESHIKASDMFKSVPGMSSQKSTAHDWYKEANESLALMNEKFPKDRFTLTQSEWGLLADVLLEKGNLVFRGKSDIK